VDVVVFRLGPQQFGIPVAQVGQVFPVAEIAPFAGASAPVRGAVDVHGELIPVVDLGRRISDAWTTLHAEQRLILVNGPTRRLMLLADEVEGVRSFSGDAPAESELIFIDDVLASEPQVR
jgi:chemotaxis-related protein WspB